MFPLHAAPAPTRTVRARVANWHRALAEGEIVGAQQARLSLQEASFRPAVVARVRADLAARRARVLAEIDRGERDVRQLSGELERALRVHEQHLASLVFEADVLELRRMTGEVPEDRADACAREQREERLAAREIGRRLRESLSLVAAARERRHALAYLLEGGLG